MISKLKTRARADVMVNEKPKARRQWDRAVYLGLLAALGLSLLNYSVGDRVLLRADGFVLRDRAVSATTALARVDRVFVSPGQIVQKGDLLFKAGSLDVLGRLADLSMRDASLAERGAALRSELDMSRALLPAARARRDDLSARLDVVSVSRAQGIATEPQRDALGSALHAAQIEVTKLEARIDGIGREVQAVVDARRHARKAIEDMQKGYGDGLHRAGVDGVVADMVPAPGEVFRPGDPIITILNGDAYVLAYLPDAYPFDLNAGDPVQVRKGKLRHSGTVAQVLPVSQSIPEEFRTAFRLDESRQMIRITLADGAVFPANSPVTVIRPLDLQPVAERIAGVWHLARDQVADAIVRARTRFETLGQRARVAELW